MYNNEIRKNLCAANAATYIERKTECLENCLMFAVDEIVEDKVLSASSRLLIIAANIVAKRIGMTGLCNNFAYVLNHKNK